MAVLRVRFVSPDDQVLVEEVRGKDGSVLLAPLSVRLLQGESSFDAAERLLFKFTGVCARRQGLRGPPTVPAPSVWDSSKEASFKVSAVTYSPLQYDNPVEYESLSSSTFPTLPTLYRINVLTLQLDAVLNLRESIERSASSRGRIVKWIKASKAKWVYSHLEIRKQSLSRSKLQLQGGLQKLQDIELETWEPEKDTEAVEEDAMPAKSDNRNHTLVHLAQNQRYSGPASVTEHSGSDEMPSVFVGLKDQLWHRIDILRRQRAFKVINRSEWFVDASNPSANTGRPSRAMLTSIRGTGSLSTLFSRTVHDFHLRTVFETMSFDSSGHLMQLSDCVWFHAISNAFHEIAAVRGVKSAVASVSRHTIQLFRLWLRHAQLDLRKYDDGKIQALLAEALQRKSELSLHRQTRRLQRIVRIAKVVVFEAVDESAEGQKFLETAPTCSRRLVLQEVGPMNDDDLEGDLGPSQNEAFHIDFSVVLNRKAQADQQMLDVVDQIVEEKFATDLFLGDQILASKDQVRSTLSIRSLFMLEPKSEANISPRFPALSSIYFLHQFWIRLDGIPSSDFRTIAPGGVQRFWMWDDEGKQSLTSRTDILASFAVNRKCSSNLRFVCRSEPVQMQQQRVDASFLAHFHAQVVEGCKSDDPLLVQFAMNQLWNSPATMHWTDAKRNRLILKCLAIALNSKSVSASHTLLRLYVRASLGLRTEWSASPIQKQPSLAFTSSQSLARFNVVLIIASLINAQPTVLQMKEALVQQKIEKQAAAPFCVLAAIRLGHAKMLSLLLEMIPHFANGPFFPGPSGENTSGGLPLWTDEARTMRAFGLSDDAVKLLRQTSSGLHVFIPGYQNAIQMSMVDLIPGFHTSYLVQLRCVLRRTFGTLHTALSRHSAKVHVIDAGDDDSVDGEDADAVNAVRPFGWSGLLAEICPLEVVKAKTPLGARMTAVLGVALSYCSPDFVLYRLYLDVYLVSIVAVCWNDVTIFGYELEAQRMIIEFLEESAHPFHAALIMAQRLRRLAHSDTYYSSELTVLHQWIEEQCVAMLHACTSQEEANAMLFEQISVEPEVTTARTFVRMQTFGTLSRHLPIPGFGVEKTSPAETSALFMAVDCRVQGVVASKLFQGTNENKIWFYEWWRPDKFPAVYERHASSVLGTALTTAGILLELICTMPLWCAAPFSVRLSRWRDHLAINSAYFKFLSHTLLHCLFVGILFLEAQRPGPIRVDQRDQIKPLSHTELAMYLWVLGLIFSEFHAVYFDPSSYFRSAVNMIDALYLACFAAAFGFRFASINLPVGAWETLPANGTRLPRESGEDELRLSWFGNEAAWNPFAAASYSDFFVAAGTLIAVYRLIHLSSYHHRLGPLYESIIKMSGDVAFYAFMMSILLFGNSLGMVFLLRRYDGGEGVYLSLDEENGSTSMSSGMRGALILLGQSLFSGEIPSSNEVFSMSWADAFCFYALVVFHLTIVVIVLTNLLIAMMNKTYEMTYGASQSVYLNGRMDLINDYARLPVVPPPLNLITIPFEMLALISNHFRFGNSRAIYLKGQPTAVGAAEFGLPHVKEATRTSNEGTEDKDDQARAQNSRPRVLPSHLHDDVVLPMLEGLRSKRKFSVNSAMRKIRTMVMARYFRRVRSELGMSSEEEKHAAEASKSTEAGLELPALPFLLSKEANTPLGSPSASKAPPPSVMEYLAAKGKL